MGMFDEMQDEFMKMIALLGVIAAFVFMFFAISVSIWLVAIPVILIAGGIFFWQKRDKFL